METFNALGTDAEMTTFWNAMGGNVEGTDAAFCVETTREC
jgi:hypothetical protein